MHTCTDMRIFSWSTRPSTGPSDVVVENLTVAGPHEPFVTCVSFAAPAGEVTVVPTAPGQPQAALALALAGRMDGTDGTVRVGGRTERRVLQSLVRLVDVEDVSAPDDALPLHTVIGEELALADQSASRSDIEQYLAQRDLTALAVERWDRVPAATRLALLTELGAWRPGTRVVVLAGPDRHGGDPLAWLGPAREIAGHGLTVVVLCAPATVATHAAARPAAPRHPTSPEEAHA